MLRTTLFLIACALLASVQALAADAAPRPFLGVGIWSRPAYVGADANVVAVFPIVRYYGKHWFARTTQEIVEGGIRAEAFTGFSVGAQLAYEGGRATDESDFLKNHHVETLPASASWGVHAEYDGKIGPMPINLLLRYRQEAQSGRGAQTDLRINAGIYGGERLKAGIFAQTTWANGKSNQSYYGITAAQAAITGLPAYNAKAGVVHNAAGLFWSFDLNAKWMFQGSLEGRQVQGDARNSPLVQVHSNLYVSTGLAYQF
jgi:outer membrane scaffolding protein for murein synthesis (MipA/OmpV family)